MSMSTYPLHEAAVLLLDDNLLKEIALHIDAETSDIIDKLQNRYLLNISTVSSFSGTVTSLRDQTETELTDSCIHYIAANKIPSLFDAAYSNFEEIGREFMQKTNNILPDGFPIESNIVSLYGTYFC